MKKILSTIILFTLFFSSFSSALALSKDAAIQAYADELVSLGLSQEAADAKATEDVNALIESMKQIQSEASHSFDAIEDRVNSLLRSDLRREEARDALGVAEGIKNNFKKLDPAEFIFLQESVAGSLPEVMQHSDFYFTEEEYQSALSAVNRILIAPTRPGEVPEGDIVSDFIPQIIRQLFRFAWLAVLIAFTVSGVMLVMAHDNEERITKAKTMIYFSLLGFAFIALAFAIVKAVTDIDFFRFI